MKGMNKRGQQMTLATIIAIVLGIAVLVFLIFGFSTGWNNLWDKIGNIGGGAANVDSISQGCKVACSGQSKDAFCEQSKKMTFGEERNITLKNGTNIGLKPSVEGTCHELAVNYTVGVSDCLGLC